MRLLSVSTLQLKEFHSDTPTYAILSHTWGPPEEEVTFQDIQNLDVARGKIGFKKIAGCCEQARKDDIEWIWVDSCSIDKSSSSELSEAINSMFKWYQRSNVCYAYLEDMGDVVSEQSPIEIVKQESDEDLDFASNIPEAAAAKPADVVMDMTDIRELSASNNELDMGSVATKRYPRLHDSRWFTRGWTLQELLAPRTVVFYDRNWTELGTKSSLKTEIEEACGIPAVVLTRGRSFGMCNAAEKMSWASTRKTTRVEDEAYCLMGLFGIHMPLLYGEGKNAFLRLQLEILRSTYDYTLFAYKHLEGRTNRSSRVGMWFRPPMATEPANFCRPDSCQLPPEAECHAGASWNYDNLQLRPGRSQTILDVPVLAGDAIKLQLPIVVHGKAKSVYSGCTVYRGYQYELLCFRLVTPVELQGIGTDMDQRLGETFDTLHYHMYLPFTFFSESILDQPPTDLLVRQKRLTWANTGLDISKTAIPDCFVLLSGWVAGNSTGQRSSIVELGEYTVFSQAEELRDTLLYSHSHRTSGSNQEILGIRPFNHHGMTLFDAKYFDNGINDGSRYKVSQTDRAVINLTDRRIYIALKPRGDLNDVSYLTVTCSHFKHNH
jgi:heterokaryon incompatibility protein (HET)